MRRATVGVTCVLALAVTAANQSAGGGGQEAGGVESSAAISAAQAEELSRRLFDLEYPELRRRDPRELDFLRRHVDVAFQTYREIDTLTRVGARGGGAQEWFQTGSHVCDALVDYCWALYAVDRDQPLHAANAVNWSRRAVLFARRNLEASRAKRMAEVEGATLTLELDSSSSLLASRRKTIRAEEVAAVANVNISSVPTLDELAKSPVARWAPDKLPRRNVKPKDDSPSPGWAPVTPPPLKPAPSKESAPTRAPSQEPGTANPRKPVLEKGRSPAGISAAQAEELSRRLFDLEYPELRRLDPRELRFLRAHVDSAFQTFREIAYRTKTGDRGGGAQEHAQSGHHACDALVDYCWALYAVDRDQPLHAANAVNWSRRAVAFAHRNSEAERAKREAKLQGATLNLVLGSQDSLLSLSLKTIRAEEVAAVANVDISGVPTLEELVESSTSRRPPQPPTPGRRPQPPTPGRLIQPQLRVAPPTDPTTALLPDELPGLNVDPKANSASPSRTPVTPPALKRTPIKKSIPGQLPTPVPVPGVPQKSRR
jgi:hypothetical protein